MQNSNPYKILVADDEDHILNAIKLNLELEGYLVITCNRGDLVNEKLRKETPDMIILDIMMPGMDGIEVCRTTREINQEIPILFLTARNTSGEKIAGLRAGADDYLTKPFDLEELILRIKILLKRVPKKNIEVPDIYKFGGNEINFLNYEISNIEQNNLTLTKKEVELLKLLIQKKGMVVSRDEILDKIWGTEVYPTSRTIDNYILAFRKYFETNQREPEFFHSIRGIGYKFTPEGKGAK